MMVGRVLPPVDLDSDDDDEMTEFQQRLLAVLQAIADELQQIRFNWANK